MKGKFFNLILVLILLAGVALLLYPTVSNAWITAHSSEAVAVYKDQTAELDEEDEEAELSKAKSYNDRLGEAASKSGFVSDNEDEYNSVLNIDGSGVMGYVEIPSIHVTLPIYHGTSDSVLQVAVGHVEWTSLPIGGEGTHTVLSGHRGLPSAKLFTDLDAVEIGDVFSVHVLNQVYYYEVDDISVIEPEDTEKLLPVAGEDYCTLMTCTPYGVNTHRLLVRGTRVYPSLTVDIESDVNQVSPILISAVAMAFTLLLIAIINKVLHRNKRKEEQDDQ